MALLRSSATGDLRRAQHLRVAVAPGPADRSGQGRRAQALNDAAAEPREELALVYRLLTVTEERTGISSAISWMPPID